MSATQESLDKIREWFRENHSYINIAGVSNSQIKTFMVRPYVLMRDFESQMDLLRDYILAEDLTEITL